MRINGSPTSTIGVTYVEGARVDIDDWPLTPAVIELLSAEIAVQIARIKAETGQHAIVVEVCRARMQITAEEEVNLVEADYEDDLGHLCAARWHGIMLSPELRRKLQEAAYPSRYERQDPV